MARKIFICLTAALRHTQEYFVYTTVVSTGWRKSDSAQGELKTISRLSKTFPLGHGEESRLHWWEIPGLLHWDSALNDRTPALKCLVSMHCLRFRMLCKHRLQILLFFKLFRNTRTFSCTYCLSIYPIHADTFEPQFVWFKGDNHLVLFILLEMALCTVFWRKRRLTVPTTRARGSRWLREFNF